MTMAAVSSEERIARIEGEVSHMATKADLERLQGETRLQTAIVVAVQIVAFLILRFLP